MKGLSTQSYFSNQFSVYMLYRCTILLFAAFVFTRFSDLFAIAGEGYESELEYFCTDYRDFSSQVFKYTANIGENRKI